MLYHFPWLEMQVWGDKPASGELLLCLTKFADSGEILVKWFIDIFVSGWYSTVDLQKKVNVLKYVLCTWFLVTHTIILLACTILAFQSNLL